VPSPCVLRASPVVAEQRYCLSVVTSFSPYLCELQQQRGHPRTPSASHHRSRLVLRSSSQRGNYAVGQSQGALHACRCAVAPHCRWARSCVFSPQNRPRGHDSKAEFVGVASVRLVLSTDANKKQPVPVDNAVGLWAPNHAVYAQPPLFALIPATRDPKPAPDRHQEADGHSERPPEKTPASGLCTSFPRLVRIGWHRLFSTDARQMWFAADANCTGDARFQFLKTPGSARRGKRRDRLSSIDGCVFQWVSLSTNRNRSIREFERQLSGYLRRLPFPIPVRFPFPWLECDLLFAKLMVYIYH
jgi:hypothetical protein